MENYLKFNSNYPHIVTYLKFFLLVKIQTRADVTVIEVTEKSFKNRTNMFALQTNLHSCNYLLGSKSYLQVNKTKQNKQIKNTQASTLISSSSSSSVVLDLNRCCFQSLSCLRMKTRKKRRTKKSCCRRCHCCCRCHPKRS